MSDDLPENRNGKPLDQIVFRAVHDELDIVETDARTFHLNPPIELEKGALYCVQVWRDHLRIWRCVVDKPCTTQEPQ